MLDRREESSVDMSSAERSMSKPGRAKSGRKAGSSSSTS